MDKDTYEELYEFLSNNTYPDIDHRWLPFCMVYQIKIKSNHLFSRANTMNTNITE